MSAAGLKSVHRKSHPNVLSSQGRFKGQRCYGYISLEEFVNAATQIRKGEAVAGDFDHALATMHTTIAVTAILEVSPL